VLCGLKKYGNTCYWAMVDTMGMPVCLCMHRKGAVEVIRWLQALDKAQHGQHTHHCRKNMSGGVMGKVEREPP
jgi:hypothetical protein